MVLDFTYEQGVLMFLDSSATSVNKPLNRRPSSLITSGMRDMLLQPKGQRVELRGNESNVWHADLARRTVPATTFAIGRCNPRITRDLCSRFWHNGIIMKVGVHRGAAGKDPPLTPPNGRFPRAHIPLLERGRIRTDLSVLSV